MNKAFLVGTNSGGAQLYGNCILVEKENVRFFLPTTRMDDVELIEKYEAFNMPLYKNCIVCIGTSSAHPFRMEEMGIIECIVSLCTGTNAFYVYTDDILELDMKVTTVFYE